MARSLSLGGVGLRAALLVAAVGLFLVACGGVKDTVIPAEVRKWDTDLAPSIERLTGTDRRLAVAYLDRTKAAASARGQGTVDAGVTVGQAIEAQRKFEETEVQSRLTSRNQQEQQDQARKDAEARAAAVFAVKLTGKEILPADLATNRSDSVAFTFEFQNTGAKVLSGVSGTLLVSDNWFGTELKTIPLDYRQSIPVGGMETYRSVLTMSPSAIIDQRVRNTDLSQMKVTFTPSLVQFADGTRMEFATALAQP